MNVACTACPAKYAVPDERVRGKKARITCKHCGTAIVVDGTVLGTAPADDTARAARRTMLGMGAPGQSSKQTMLGLGSTPTAAAPRTPSAPRHDVPSSAGGAWLVALSEQRREPASLPRILDLFTVGEIGSSTYIWREDMDEWKTPFEIPEIASALKARGFVAGFQTSGSRDLDQEEATRVAISVAEELARPVPPSERPAARRPATGDDDDGVTIARNGPPSSAPQRPERRSSPASQVPSPKVFPSKRPTLPNLMAVRSPSQRAADAAAAASGNPGSANVARRAPSGTAQLRAKATGSTESSVSRGLPAAARAVQLEPPVAAFEPLPEAPPPPPPPPVPLAPALTPTPAATGSAAIGRVANLVAASAHAVPTHPQAPDYEFAPRSAAPVSLPLEFDDGSRRRRRVAFSVAGILGVAVIGAIVALRVESRPKPAPVPAAPAALTTTTPTATAPAAPIPPATAEPSAVASGETPAASSSAAAQSTGAPPPRAAAPAARRDEAVAASRAWTARRIEPKPAAAAKPQTDSLTEQAPVSDSSSTPEPPQPLEETPKKEEGPSAPEGVEFSRDAASQALADAASRVDSCRTMNGPMGGGQVTVIFAPSGRVSSASVGGEFAGTAVGACIIRLFRSATVPPFSGEPVTVAKRFSIE